MEREPEEGGEARKQEPSACRALTARSMAAAGVPPAVGRAFYYRHVQTGGGGRGRVLQVSGCPAQAANKGSSRGLNPASEAPTPRLPWARAAAGDEEWASHGSHVLAHSVVTMSEFITACSPVTRSAFGAAGLSFTHPHRTGDMSLLQRNLHPKNESRGSQTCLCPWLIAALFTRAERWRQPTCPAVDARISRMCDCSPWPRAEPPQGRMLAGPRRLWLSKTSRSQRGDAVSLHLYEALRAAKFIETEWNVGARACRGWGGGR